MSLLLVFDTATTECAVGLGIGSDGTGSAPALLGEMNISTPRAALTHLIPAITRLLDECRHVVADIDGVVVGRGPGSFTGVRIGMATAKGLAQGLGVPLYGVGTLDAVAERFSVHEGLVGVVGDAMRGEVYPALFRCGGGRVLRLTPDSVCSPIQAAQEWAEAADEPVVLTGEGLAKHVEVFTAALGSRAEVSLPAMWTPTGSSLLQAAWRLDVSEAGGDVGALLPIYTRLSDAEEAEAVRTGLAASAPDGSGVKGPGKGGSGRSGPAPRPRRGRTEPRDGDRA